MSTRKPGDWTCPGCHGLCFARRDVCRCGVARPRPGDWRCARCNDHCFASRTACRCGAPKGEWKCAGCARVCAPADAACACGVPREPAGRSTTATAPAARPPARPVVGAPPEGVDEPTDENPCVVCLENRRAVMSLRCGHNCVCFGCSYKIKTACPICRGPWVDLVRVFS